MAWEKIQNQKQKQEQQQILQERGVAFPNF